MAEDSEEEDYMSDAILAQCGDTRPGLSDINMARNREIERKKKDSELLQKKKHIPVKEKERIQRETGLQQELGKDNKGFNMLQKMGYEPGMSIGSTGVGIKSPITIQIKEGRSGLGHATDEDRKRKATAEFRRMISEKRQKNEELYRGEFKTRMKEGLRIKQMVRDLVKSQRICEDLDKQQGCEVPAIHWYWCNYDDEEEEEDDETADAEDYADELSDDDVNYRLQTIITYLRETYHYCIWCAVKFDDQADLEENCPGNTWDDHQ